MADERATTLRPLMPNDLPLLARLGDYYAYDLSDRFDLELDAQGRFSVIDAVQACAGVDPGYIILHGGSVAGFVLLWRNEDKSLLLDDFFVMRQYQRIGVGRAAARAVCRRHPGRWTGTVRVGNERVLPFWRGTLEPFGPIEEPASEFPDRKWRYRFTWSVGAQ